MSEAFTSAWAPNSLLYGATSGNNLINTQRNALNMQQEEQQVGAANMEVVARAGLPLLNMSEEEAARAYGPLRQHLQSQGYGKNLPEQYPGHAATRQFVALGIPAEKQFEYGAGRTAASGAASGLGLGGPGGGGGGAADGTPSGPVMGPRGPGSATRGEAEGGPPAPGSPGAAVAQRTYDFWKSKGYSDPIIAGIMAGGPGSESDFTPSVYGDNRSSYGLYQHHGPRLEGMRKYFGLTGDAMPTEQQQNEYAYWEITQGPLARVGTALAQAKTPEEAATIWTRDFGVPADKTEIGRRARGAGRYAGRYGGAAAPPGAPGVQVGSPTDTVAPPPPGPAGTVATAPSGPGGFAAALAPPAVAAAAPPGTVPRETQVIGPNGQVQTVVRPVPATPGPQQTSAIEAIQAGRLNALSATPASAMPMVAGPGGAGPEAQPLRPIEPGWGTGTPGSYGYSGGSPTPGTVAPAPAPAPVPAAQQPPPPAQPAAPQVPLAPVLPLKPSGLTAQQEDAARSALSAPGVTVARVNEITAHYQALAAQNRTYNEQAAQRNYERTRQAAGDVRQAEKDAREAAAAADPLQGKTDDERMERTLLTIGPKVRAGQKLTSAEEDQYDLMRTRYAEGPVQQVPDGKGGTILAHVPREVPARFPPLPGRPETTGPKPIPGTERQPDPAPAAPMTAMLDIQAGNRGIVNALDALEKYPAGVGVMRGSQPNVMSNWTDPEGVKVRAAVGIVQGHIYHSLAGTAQSAGETARLASFVPGNLDDAEAAKVKLRGMLDNNRATLLDHYRAFGPDSGFRRQPAIEEEILATIPEDAIERLKKEHDTKLFDRKYGRGAAKLALQNG